MRTLILASRYIFHLTFAVFMVCLFTTCLSVGWHDSYAFEAAVWYVSAILLFDVTWKSIQQANAPRRELRDLLTVTRQTDLGTNAKLVVPESTTHPDSLWG